MNKNVLRSAKRRTCTKFHQDSFKTERLVCLETDRWTDRRTWLYRLSSSPWSI